MPEWLEDALGYVSGASAQYLDDVTLGAWSALVVKVDLNLIDNEAYQQGRETGRSISTAQAEFEIATGIGVGITGAAAIPVTLGGGTLCAIGTAGICAIPAGGALVIEGVMVVGGAATTAHGIVMMARSRKQGKNRDSGYGSEYGKESAQKHGRPGNNRVQNKQFEDAVNAAQRKLGIEIDDDMRRELHYAVQDLENPGFDDIYNLAIDWYGRN